MDVRDCFFYFWIFLGLLVCWFVVAVVTGGGWWVGVKGAGMHGGWNAIGMPWVVGLAGGAWWSVDMSGVCGGRWLRVLYCVVASSSWSNGCSFGVKFGVGFGDFLGGNSDVQFGGCLVVVVLV